MIIIHNNIKVPINFFIPINDLISFNFKLIGLYYGRHYLLKQVTDFFFLILNVD